MAMSFDAFITRRLPGDVHLKAQQRLGCRVFGEDRPPSRDELLDSARGARGLLCLLTDQIDRAVIEALPDLVAISVMAVGYDNIDLQACVERHIAVGHTPDVLTEATADLTWALLLAAARRVTEAERYLREGRWITWDPGLLLGRDVHGATLGIVGFGRIGRAVARRARGFEMQVLACSRGSIDETGVSQVALDELLERSDFVSLHVSLNDETRRLIDTDALRRMKPGAILINTSRGDVVDQSALVKALAGGRLGAAGLDVYEDEPLSADDPLTRLDNVVLLPHIGSATIETRTAMAEVALENLEAALQGRPMPHPVPMPGVGH